MNSFLDAAKSRYTTKKYDATAKLTDAQLEEIKEILRLSPSSINSQPWKFTVVSSEKAKNEFAKVSSYNAPKIENASHLIVFSVLNNVQLFEKQLNENNIQGQIDFFNNNIKHWPEAEIKNWMAHQVYLSLGFLLSACAVMGIDATPMEGINKEAYTQLLAQNDYKVLFAVALGKRADDDSNQPDLTPKQRLSSDKVIENI